MKKHNTKMKGKKALSMLLALIMVLAIASPAFSPIIAKAANTYPVELAFENLFVFDDWARNDLSTTVMPRELNPGTLETDVQNGSFRLTKTDMAVDEIFTAFGMDAVNAANNAGYYTMEVEPNTTYGFDYYVTGNVFSFTPYVFMFDSNNLYQTLVAYPTPNYYENSFTFTTPENVTKIQIRFTIGDDTTKQEGNYGESSVYADVKDIAIYEIENIYSENLFSFSEWATKGQSHLPATSLGWGGGTVDVNAAEESMTLTTNATGALLLTNFTMSETATDNSAYHTIPVEANTAYTLAYNLVNANNLPAAAYCQPFIAYYREDGSFITFQNNVTPGYGKNNFTFTTPADTEYIQVVFSLHTTDTVSSITVKDIGVYDEITTVSHKTTPIRKVYTYGKDETYTNLPTPSYIPDGYVFAGWFTEPDGEGQRITPETKVSYESYTVYPKYEPEVDTLEIASMPTKTVYTKGEKLNTAGLSLKATQTSTQMVEEWNDVDGDEEVDNGEITTVEKEVTRTFNINSGVYCTPEYLNTVGTQTITAHYGGEEVTFTVTVLENGTTDIVVNGTIIKDVSVTNNKYTLNSDATAFNRYKIAYSTDSYVRGIITFENDITEEFFLEPNDNGNFVSFIDDFLEGNTHNYIKTVEFTCLDKEFGSFQLKAVTTDVKEVTGNTAYYRNAEYEMGIALNYGGVVSELYDIDDPVTARVYDGGLHPGDNFTPMTRTQIDYKYKLDENYGSGYSEESEKVNLINTLDRGRYLQQSYYGTGDRPYEQGWFNSADWNYNPVQGGNVALEASKVIDYEITDNYVYVKARPLDWAKWSDEFANNDDTVDDNGKKVYEPKWGEDYITDTYVEAWYYFEDGMIKVTNRKVDYSGLPENYTTQEFPALYLVEPLNHFVYNNVTADQAWKNDYSSSVDNGTIKNIEEPEFWGIIPSYQEYHGLKDFDPTVDCNENWAAFTASEDPDSFGIGIYSASTTDFAYGVMPQVYAQDADLSSGEIHGETDIKNYRHAETINPSPELPTSYIAPVGMMLFKSYDPTEYTYYLTTGTAEEIRGDFSLIGDKEAAAELAKAKVAVPETVYMNPADNKNGQYYVNNILNEHDYYNVETVAESAETDMYFGLHVEDADSFKINVTNVTNSDNDIILGNGDGTGNREGETIKFDSSLIDSYISGDGFSLRLTNALNPGEIATAKWEITVTKKDGSTENHTAYTVLYAPERTVGAVAEARQVNASQHEISSWITGANGVDHSKRAPLGSFHGDVHDSGYFREDPLVYENPPTGGSGKNSHDYIITTDPSELQDGGVNESDDYSETAYVLQAATDDHDSSRAQSYLGLLTVDKSRYTNTDQIPNLRIGYDVLRIGSYVKNSLGKYTTYYTLGNESAYTATSLSAAPSGWTVYSGTYTDFANNHNLPYRESFVPSFAVSDIDGKYIHALNQGIADQTVNTNQYSTAGTSVLCSVTDKSGLRDAVLNGYTQTEDDPEFIEKLEKAATILGDPSATQTEIDEARRELNENITAAYYSLKYDNLFSAYEYSQKSGGFTTSDPNGVVTYSEENAAITVTSNNTERADVSVDNGNNPDVYYNIDVKGSTEYIFEYDLDSVGGSQMHLFFFDNDSANPQAKLTPTGKSYTWTPEGGSTQTVDQTANTDPFACVYAVGEGHVVMRFTTPAGADRVAFRFGNAETTTSVSTFSNIRFIEAGKYYADATYSKTEDVYKEYQSYGTLITPVRTGYTFLGWEDASGNDVTGADIATEHKSIYSQWDEHTYTITYNANGGSGSVANQSPLLYSADVELATGGFTNKGYTLAGWSTDPDATVVTYQPGQTVNRLTGENNGIVTLYAVWAEEKINVTFDNLFDYSNFNINTGSLVIDERTDTGFTITSTTGTDANTGFSAVIPVEAGKTYIFSAETSFVPVSGGFDMYINTLDENQVGETSATVDTSNGAHKEGDVYISLTGQSQNVTNPYIKFTAGDSTAYIKIRFDANAAGNKLTVNNIRVWEDNGVDYTDVEANKIVVNGFEYGELPTPTRDGYTFMGWYNASDEQITAETTMTSSETVNLFSKWEINDTALEADTVVIDFDLPVAINPLANDTIFMAEAEKEGNSYKLNGISSTENGTYSTSLTGTYGEFAVDNKNVTFTPNKTIDGVVTLYYSVTITADSKDTTLTESITIAPASNVYYEETVFEKVSYGTADWSTVAGGTSANYSDSTDAVYGFDNTYNNTNTYSNGKTLFTAVDSTNKLSAGQKVKFVGDGIDIISACGPTTGIQIIDIKDAKTGKYVATRVVDTYYADDTFSQVPIFSWRGEYGEYIVETSAAYLSSSGALKRSSVKNSLIDTGLVMNSSDDLNTANVEAMLEAAGVKDIDTENLELVWFDDNSVLNGGTGVAPTKKGARAGETESVTLNNYLDGFRVYNPLGSDSSAYDVGEQGAVYYNVIDSLADGTLSDGTLDFESGKVAFVTGNLADGELSFATYESVGPKNELYLEGNAPTGLFFKTPVANGGKVMVSLRAVNGPTTVSINGQTFTINSATEMYYDITGLLDVTNNSAEVTIINTGSGILAVNNIKLTNTVSASGLMPLGMEDLETVQYYASMEPVQVSVKNGVITPVVIEDEIPDDGANTGNNDTTTDRGESEEFSIFSLLKMLLAFIENILRGAFGNGNLF